MGKSRVSVKGKLYNLGLRVVVATGVGGTVAAATTTTPKESVSAPVTVCGLKRLDINW